MHAAVPRIRKRVAVAAALALLALALMTILTRAPGPSAAKASSHAEAPLISQDPRADNTDLYAFVSPDDTSTVTIIANYIPLEAPASGPNFYSFDDSVLYEIKIDNNGDGTDDISYQFRFNDARRGTRTRSSTTPGRSRRSADPNWNRPQTYDVTLVQFKKNGKVEGRKDKPVVLGSDIPTPPDNIGPRSTPNYDALAAAAVTNLPGGIKVFAGQRDDPFFVDLGSIFDLAGLRPFNPFHLIPLPAAPGVDALAELQHALDRDPGADLAARPGSATRRSASTRAPSRQKETRPQRRRHEGRQRPVGPGLAARQPADQRGRDPARREGLLEPLGSGGRRAVRALLHDARGRRASRTCSTALRRRSRRRRAAADRRDRSQRPRR